MTEFQTHECMISHESNPPLPSERKLGIAFGIVFTLVGLTPLFHSGALRMWSFIPASIFFLIAYLRPMTLRPLNIVWFKLGLLLNRVANPIVLGIMFFGVITPTAIVIRLLEKKLIPTHFDPNATSYWIERDPPGPSTNSVYRQF